MEEAKKEAWAEAVEVAEEHKDLRKSALKIIYARYLLRIETQILYATHPRQTQGLEHTDKVGVSFSRKSSTTCLLWVRDMPRGAEAFARRLPGVGARALLPWTARPGAQKNFVSARWRDSKGRSLALFQYFSLNTVKRSRLGPLQNQRASRLGSQYYDNSTTLSRRRRRRLSLSYLLRGGRLPERESSVY